MPCVDDYSSADSYGDDCDVYTGDPNYCATDEYDTANFVASEQCCACGGGSIKSINE